MKLNPFSWVLPVPQPHHDAFLSLCANLKACWYVRHHQRVVTRCGKSLRQRPENSFGIMEYRACFSMHQRRSTNNFPAKDLTDSLVSQANTENRDGLVKTLNDLL